MDQPMSLDRRRFVAALGAGTLMLPGAVRAARAARPDPVFTHGVASGDPLSDRVILWTRVDCDAEWMPVMWEVARDPGFRQVVSRGRTWALRASDGTVKVDAAGLPPGTWLYYRFFARGRFSAAGRTRTLPVGSVAQVKLAVFSCANYPAGYFHAYAEAAKVEGLDAAVHLGDYLYEYGRGGYASELAVALGREVEPAGEILALDDYRARYAQYRSDPDLQALHAALPWICVWDDHEIANDAWKGGAENHTPGAEGDFAMRRAAAVRAYHEWMPTRVRDDDHPERIYRAFNFGDLLDLTMLETRLVARGRPMDYANYFGAGGFDAARFGADLADPTRQMLGDRQHTWLTARMAASRATWTVLGQQVLMARMSIPAPLVLGQISFSAYSTLLVKAQSAPGTLTPQELAVLAQPAIPYNLDAWDGYAAARERVLVAARVLDKNLVVLAGDTHNAWASDLADAAGRAVGVEFATPGVSSPGLESLFPNENPALVAAGLAQIIGPLRWAETAHRGFMVVTATRERCQAQWHFVSTVSAADYTVARSPTWATFPGSGGRTLIEV
jgi:alkaline phosphatase D